MSVISYTADAGRPHLPFVAYLETWLPKAVVLIADAPAEISIALVGDTKMASLHEQFMQVPGSTDVLTFELDHDDQSHVTSGEIVVCVPYARREARRRKIAPEQEVLLYALHGVLHLSGFDDLEPADHQRMHEEEDSILKQIGIGAVFRRTA
jgi:probable rRNA maturation factor